MKQHVSFLGWNELDIWLGTPALGNQQFTPIILDWQPGDVRNCSYAPRQGWIGITAEDRMHRQQVLAIYEARTKTTRVLLRAEYVLRHSLNRAGTEICYTQPSNQKGGADLFLLKLESGEQRRLAESVVAYGGTPVWFPDDTRIAYSSPQNQIEIFHVLREQSETLVEGSAPAIHPDGSRIAFHRANQLGILNLLDGTTKPLNVHREWLESSLTDGLSWSPDGSFLSFGLVSGLVGKEAVFYLLDPVNRRQQKIEVRYMRGLIII